MNSLFRSLVTDVFDERRVRLICDAEETDRIATKVNNGNHMSKWIVLLCCCSARESD